MMNFFAQILSPLIRFIYSFTGQNYVLTLLLFTIAVRIILLPLSIKQQRSMLQQQKIQPQIKALQEKYKDDREKLNEETMKLYEKEGVSPTGGCLPLLIQFPVLMGLYQTIRRPLTYILGYSAAHIVELIQSNLTKLAPIQEKLGETVSLSTMTLEQYTKTVSMHEINIASLLDEMNFSLFGINLAETADFHHFSVLWIFPIIAALCTFLTSAITKWLSKSKNSSKTKQDSNMPNMGVMNFMMAGMTLMFGFSLPNALAFYWVIGSVWGIGQQIILTKWLNKEKENQ